VIRGWGNYFRYGNSGQKFDHIDAYVNERLALLASAKHGRTGRNGAAPRLLLWVAGQLKQQSRRRRWCGDEPAVSSRTRRRLGGRSEQQCQIVQLP
jgi:Group II intron, maturase-specific domain